MKGASARLALGLLVLTALGGCGVPDLLHPLVDGSTGDVTDSPPLDVPDVPDAGALDGSPVMDVVDADAADTTTDTLASDLSGDVTEVSDAPDGADAPDALGASDGCTSCGGACVDLTTDLANCGACGTACLASANATTTCSAGMCHFTCTMGFADCDGMAANGCEVDLTTAVRNCGACHAVCDVTHGAPACAAGSCRIACDPGFGDCNSAAADGCEINLNTTATACGACGHACALDNATAGCAAGACTVMRCNTGFGDCDGMAANGCEVDLNATVGACGGCGSTCSVPNATPACVAGHCAVASCNAGFDNCDGDPANGCETDVRTSNANCMRCGNVCGAGTVCSSGNCGSVCASPTTFCSASCFNLSTSLTHCGSCVNACPARDHANAACVASECSFTCMAPFADCDGAPANGCETDLHTTASCGACGRTCAPANATGACPAGICTVASCATGFGDCNSMATDGCETATTSNTSNCGACGAACPTRANTTTTCAASTCGFTCNTGFGNCNGMPLDGCEVATTSDTANCGACGTACPSRANAMPTCAAGTCGFTCNTGFGNCNSMPLDGCEATFATSTLNCGSCGHACPTPANASPTCAGGSCDFVCNTGFHNCGGVCVSNGATATCGATSCVACAVPANATATCSGMACGLACNSGFQDCDHDASNGCEINLTTSNANCGACGTVCAAGTHCGSGSCMSSCPTGTTYCTAAAVCANLMTETANCGTCGNVCPTRAHTTTTCAGGTCVFTCNTGFGDCNAMTPDGCEVDLSATAANCSTCGHACTAPSNGTATCASGTCGFVCNAGFHTCGSACASNSSTATCGTSCSPCAVPPNAAATCSGTACGYTCNTGLRDCDGASTNGCEISITNNPSNCGACGTTCSAPSNGTPTCAGSACGFTCNFGYVLFGGACIVIAAPRSVSPLSTATVTSRRPTLRWALFAGTDGAHVDICRDRACVTIEQSLDGTGTSARVTTDLSPGVHYWRLTGTSLTYGRGAVVGPVWEFFVGARSPAVDTSWGTVADFNGDGYADVVVGAPFAMGSTGQAYVYPGSASGIAMSPALTLAGPDSAGDYFGTAVASAGDVNGDGYADLVVGTTAANRADVYLGSSSGLAAAPATTLSVPGGAGGSFGRTVASAGDVNRDGYADVVVGGGTDASGYGQALLYLGSSSGLATVPATTMTDTAVSGDLGYAVAGAGDINGDGYADVVVGGRNDQAAYIYLGNASGLSSTPATTLTGPDTGLTQFGYSVASAGDLNADGYADVVVGAWRTTSFTGRVHVYLGSSGGLVTTPTSLTGSASSEYGAAVAGAGDTNGDGYADLVVGADAATSNTGQAYIYLGSATGVTTAAAPTLSGPDGASSQFGNAVASAGDTNGDGYAEVVVGAPNAMSGNGLAHVYRGSASGLVTSPATMLAGPVGQFGYSVASAAPRRDNAYACFASVIGIARTPPRAERGRSRRPAPFRL